MNDKKRIDIDSPRERFLGWLPQNPASIVCFILVIAYYAFIIITWRNMPAKMVLGWWPICEAVACFVYAPALMLIMGLYAYKFWPALEDDDDVD